MSLSWGVEEDGCLVAAFASKQLAEYYATTFCVDVVEMQPKFLRIKDVVQTTAMSKPWIYEQMAKGEFPKPIPIGSGRANVWIQSEVDEWKRKIIRNSRKVDQLLNYQESIDENSIS